MVAIVAPDPVCATCDHKHDKHQHTLTANGKRPCLYVKRNGRYIESKCDCLDYVETAGLAGAAALKARTIKEAANKK